MSIHTESIRHGFAPQQVLKAAINLGNPILANWDEATQRPYGVSVDMAHELARRLAVDIELVIYKAAGKSVAGVAAGEATVGFFALDPVRGQEIAFTRPYVLIEGCYLVRDGSPLQDNTEVDRAAHRVVVGQGSAYDLYLTRELQQAQIVRSPTSPGVVDVFVDEQADVAAGVKQQLEADARRLGGMRLLPGRFMVIEQAMGMARGAAPELVAYLVDFVEDCKRSGFVSDALKRHSIEGASVAPLG